MSGVLSSIPGTRRSCVLEESRQPDTTSAINEIAVLMWYKYEEEKILNSVSEDSL
jgi:hypothetical protein